MPEKEYKINLFPSFDVESNQVKVVVNSYQKICEENDIRHSREWLNDDYQSNARVLFNPIEFTITLADCYRQVELDFYIEKPFSYTSYATVKEVNDAMKEQQKTVSEKCKKLDKIIKACEDMKKAINIHANRDEELASIVKKKIKQKTAKSVKVSERSYK